MPQGFALTSIISIRVGSMRNLHLALIAVLLASTPHALACGGGGSGSYRKPARPGQHQHQQSSAAPAFEKESTAPQVAPQ
jgi:hypothetical protein